MKAQLYKCRIGFLIITIAFLSSLQASMIQSSADELENIELIDQQIHNIGTFVQDSYEQFNYKVLNAEKHQQNQNNLDGQLSLAQKDSQNTKMKANLVGQAPLEDNMFVQLNSEIKFNGFSFGQIFNFVTFGAFKKKDEPPKQEVKNDVHLQQNASNSTNEQKSAALKPSPVQAPQPKMIQSQTQQVPQTNQQQKKQNLESMISSIDKTFNTVQMIAGKNLTVDKIETNQPKFHANSPSQKQFNSTLALSKMNISGGNHSLMQQPLNASNSNLQNLLMNNIKKVVKNPNSSKAFKNQILNKKKVAANQTLQNVTKPINQSISKTNQSTNKNISMGNSGTTVSTEYNSTLSLQKEGMVNNTVTQTNNSEHSQILGKNNQSQVLNKTVLMKNSTVQKNESSGNSSQMLNQSSDAPKSETEVMAQEDSWAASVICDEDDQECAEKKAKILDDGVDPMVKYVSNMLAEHQDEESTKNVTDVFEKQANKDGDENGMLTKDKAQLAYEQVFENWNVELTSEQEMRLDQNQFQSTWQEFVGVFDGRINPSDGPAFMKKLLSMSQEDRDKIQAYKVRHHQAPAQSLVQQPQPQPQAPVDIEEPSGLMPSQKHQKESLFEEQVAKLHDKQDYEMTQALADVGKDFSVSMEPHKTSNLFDNLLEDELNTETNDSSSY